MLRKPLPTIDFQTLAKVNHAFDIQRFEFSIVEMYFNFMCTNQTIYEQDVFVKHPSIEKHDPDIWP